MAELKRDVTEKGEPKLIVTDPEYTLSIIGLVASFCGQPLVGLILSTLALKQSKRAARHNTYALVGFIISIVLLALWVLFVIFYIVVIVFGVILTAHGQRG